MKSDIEELGDCAPKTLQVSNGPIVESMVVSEIQGPILSQPIPELGKVAISDPLWMWPPEGVWGERDRFHCSLSILARMFARIA
jgi:hypothetical protein